MRSYTLIECRFELSQCWHTRSTETLNNSSHSMCHRSNESKRKGATNTQTTANHVTSEPLHCGFHFILLDLITDERHLPLKWQNCHISLCRIIMTFSGRGEGKECKCLHWAYNFEFSICQHVSTATATATTTIKLSKRIIDMIRVLTNCCCCTNTPNLFWPIVFEKGKKKQTERPEKNGITTHDESKNSYLNIALSITHICNIIHI